MEVTISTQAQTQKMTMDHHPLEGHQEAADIILVVEAQVVDIEDVKEGQGAMGAGLQDNQEVQEGQVAMKEDFLDNEEDEEDQEAMRKELEIIKVDSAMHSVRNV